MQADDTLPRDGQSILELAARSMFHLFSSISQGMFLVDRTGRIVWLNEGYKRFLPALGFSSVDQVVGHMVEDVVPNTQMRRVLETGQPILIDLLTNRAGTFVVSRMPLRDEQSGELIGAIGIVLFDHPETTLQPLISKFAQLQRDLDDARRELASQRRTKYTLASFVGGSPAAVEVKRQARRAALSSSPVLLLGETGTGKELLAHAIHAASARAAGPLVSVNIAAVPDTLLEAEFFGVAPGAYTGADRKGRDGKFKLADGGTLFLDEIGDMPLGLQPKLLRALQEGEIEPLGSNKVVRLRCARDRRHFARPGGAGARGQVPRGPVLPAERAADPGAAAARAPRPTFRRWSRCWREDMALRSGSAPPELSADAMALLAAQNWRGNIRELRNVLEQAAMRSDSHRIEVPAPRGSAARVRHQADRSAQPSRRRSRRRRSPVLRPLAEQVAELERQAIDAALAATGGNKVAAAKLLGISRAKLYERLEAVPDIRTVPENKAIRIA